MPLTKTPTSMIDTTGATAGQVLTYNNSTGLWVASAAPTGSVISNAFASVFTTATILSATGSGTWTAPGGVTSARITAIAGGGLSGGGGGGGGGWCTVTLTIVPNTAYSYTVGAAAANISVPGGDTRFNYPTGTAPGLNQIWCQGGSTCPTGQQTGASGGSAKWNNFVGYSGAAGGAVNANGGNGDGGFGGGGYGGGGGAGGYYVSGVGGGGGSWGRVGVVGNYGGYTGGNSGGPYVPLSHAALAILPSTYYGCGGYSPGNGVIIVEY